MSGLTAASLGSLGVSESALRSKLLAADALSQASRQTFTNLKQANELLAGASSLASTDRSEAAAMLVAARTIFNRVEHDCAQSGAAYCTDPKVEAYASFFRSEMRALEEKLNRARLAAAQGPVQGPVQPTPDEWVAIRAAAAAAPAPVRQTGDGWTWVGAALPPPTDMALTQRVVAQNNLSNQQSSLSAHSQAAAIRNQWSSNRAPAPSYPRPMTDPRQNQIILATRTQQGGLSTGAKIAAAGLAAVAILSIGVILWR